MKRTYEEQLDAFEKDPRAFARNHVAVSDHVDSAHVHVSDVRMLSKVLSKNGKYADSKFLPDVDMTELLVENLKRNFETINSFMNGPHDSRVICFAAMKPTADGKGMEPRYIGAGFTQEGLNRKPRMTPNGEMTQKKQGILTHIEYAQTNQFGCVIRKSIDHPDGWEITSMFPMMQPNPNPDPAKCEILPDTHIDKVPYPSTSGTFAHILHATAEYQAASNVLKTYMDLTCAGRPRSQDVRFQYVPETVTRSTPSIQILPQFKGGYGAKQSPYPQIKLFQGEQPGAKVYFDRETGMNMNSPAAKARLQTEMPEMAEAYRAMLDAIPESMRPMARAKRAQMTAPKPDAEARPLPKPVGVQQPKAPPVQQPKAPPVQKPVEPKREPKSATSRSASLDAIVANLVTSPGKEKGMETKYG